jgi:adenylate cyclase
VNFFPFRYKILGAFLVLFSAVLISSLSLVSARQRSEAHAGIVDQLRTTQKVFDTLLGQRKAELQLALRILSSDHAFKQAVAKNDPGTTDSAARNIQSRIKADGVWVTDDDAVLTADTVGIRVIGESLEGVKIIEDALEEEPGFEVMLLADRIYQVAATPLLAPDVIGVLLAGFEIDDRFARRLAKVTASDFSFVAGGKIFASTLAEDARAALEKNLGTVPSGRAGFIDAGGQRWIVLRIPVSNKVKNKVDAYVQRSWTKALEPLEELRQLLGLIGAAGLVLTALLGFLIASGVTRSMEKLAAATESLVSGNYDVRVEIAQRDEIGKLGKAFNRMIVGLKEKEKMRSVLNKAVSKEIAEELLKRGELKLGGEERTVTVLFSDIRGFTTISEQLEPQELVTQLNDYFKRMGRAVEENQGVIDKYVGDAIMALFGAPVDSAEDADHGLRAALAMTSALEELNSDRSNKGLDSWNMGVGLNTGVAVAGNMGSENRSSYTAIGDSVNLASRLEGLTKYYQVKIIASRSVRESAGKSFHWRPLDLVRVKGKDEPVEIFELLGEGGEAEAWLAPFSAGIAAYRTRDFKSAQASFRAVLDQRPEDGPAKMYLSRLEPLLASGAGEDWDPAHTMLEK